MQALLLAIPAIAIPLPPATSSGIVVVPIPSPYSYDAGSFQQLNLKGNFGRYIGFRGHTLIEWPATPAQLNPGQPGTLQCFHCTCWLQVTIAPTMFGCTPAVSMRSFFLYQLECRALCPRAGNRWKTIPLHWLWMRPGVLKFRSCSNEAASFRL